MLGIHMYSYNNTYLELDIHVHIFDAYAWPGAEAHGSSILVVTQGPNNDCYIHTYTNMYTDYMSTLPVLVTAKGPLNLIAK